MLLLQITFLWSLLWDCSTSYSHFLLIVIFHNKYRFWWQQLLLKCWDYGTICEEIGTPKLYSQGSDLYNRNKHSKFIKIWDGLCLFIYLQIRHPFGISLWIDAASSCMLSSLELPTLGGLIMSKCMQSSVLNLKQHNINKLSVTKQLGNGSFFPSYCVVAGETPTVA